MPNFKDLTGQRFGRLTVLGEAQPFLSGDKAKQHRRFTAWRCKCDCGNIVEVRSYNLTTGNTRSCGCMRIKMQRDRMKSVWSLIKEMEREEENGNYEN